MEPWDFPSELKYLKYPSVPLAIRKPCFKSNGEKELVVAALKLFVSIISFAMPVSASSFSNINFISAWEPESCLAITP